MNGAPAWRAKHATPTPHVLSVINMRARLRLLEGLHHVDFKIGLQIDDDNGLFWSVKSTTGIPAANWKVVAKKFGSPDQEFSSGIAPTIGDYQKNDEWVNLFLQLDCLDDAHFVTRYWITGMTGTNVFDETSASNLTSLGEVLSPFIEMGTIYDSGSFTRSAQLDFWELWNNQHINGPEI
jgi:hypothetical protein